jgi:hypothetical protein
MRTRIVLAAVGATVAAALCAPGAHASTVHNGVLQPAKGLVKVHSADQVSGNWAGYDVDGSNITAVTTNYVVPAAGFTPPGLSSTWVGIGGSTTQDLIQAGTEQDTVQGTNAWYEILPASETPITSGCTGDSTCTVTAGDHMTVAITEINQAGVATPGTNHWRIDMADVGKWTWSLTLDYTSTHSSAEWIHEAPSIVQPLVLASAGTVLFGNDNTYTDASGTHVIGAVAGAAHTIALSPLGLGLVYEAVPSALGSDKSSFSVCTWISSCTLAATGS